MAMHLVKTHVPLCLILKYWLPSEMTVGRERRLRYDTAETIECAH
jgi:hypothetical protein